MFKQPSGAAKSSRPPAPTRAQLPQASAGRSNFRTNQRAASAVAVAAAAAEPDPEPPQADLKTEESDAADERTTCVMRTPEKEYIGHSSWQATARYPEHILKILEAGRDDKYKLGCAEKDCIAQALMDHDEELRDAMMPPAPDAVSSAASAVPPEREDEEPDEKQKAEEDDTGFTVVRSRKKISKERRALVKKTIEERCHDILQGSTSRAVGKDGRPKPACPGCARLLHKYSIKDLCVRGRRRRGGKKK